MSTETVITARALAYYEAGLRLGQVRRLSPQAGGEYLSEETVYPMLTRLRRATERTCDPRTPDWVCKRLNEIQDRMYSRWKEHCEMEPHCPGISPLDQDVRELRDVLSAAPKGDAAAWLDLGWEVAKVRPGPVSRDVASPALRTWEWTEIDPFARRGDDPERNTWTWDNPERLQMLLTRAGVDVSALFVNEVPDEDENSLPDLSNDYTFDGWPYLEAALQILRRQVPEGGKTPERTVTTHSTSSRVGPSGKKPLVRFPDLADLRWNEVTMTLISEESVRIMAREITRNYNYTELGLKDGRTGKPTNAWMCFRGLAKGEGELSWGSNTGDRVPGKAKKNIQALRTTLTTLMGIADDPFHPYKASKAYQTQFNLIDERFTPTEAALAEED